MILLTKVADVKADKQGITTRENTVEDKFGNLKGASWRASVSRIANVLATYGDASAIGVVLVWLDFTHDFGVGDLLGEVTGDFIVCNDKEGVGTLDTWAQAGGIFANALTDMAELVGVGLVPNTLVFGMFLELAIFKCVARVKVENVHGPVC